MLLLAGLLSKLNIFERKFAQTDAKLTPIFIRCKVRRTAHTMSTITQFSLNNHNELDIFFPTYHHTHKAVIALLLQSQRREKAPKQHHADTDLVARLRHLVRACGVEPHASNSH